MQNSRQKRLEERKEERKKRAEEREIRDQWRMNSFVDDGDDEEPQDIMMHSSFPPRQIESAILGQKSLESSQRKFFSSQKVVEDESAKVFMSKPLWCSHAS